MIPLLALGSCWLLAACSSKQSTPVDAAVGGMGQPAAGGGDHAAARTSPVGGAVPGSAGGAAGRATDAGRAAGGSGGQATDAAMPQPDAAAADSGMPAACQRCTAYGAPQQTGTLEPAELDALSGLALSRAQPGILFAHNDHDRPVVFALDLQGKLHATITLTGATASDIEDIAVGPCGADSCVFLADTGDNAVSRSEYAVLRFKQPEVPDVPGSTALTPSFERFRFTYPDGSHNAESLLVGPNGTLYVITKLAPGTGGAVKAGGPSSVYKLEPSALDASKAVQAVKVATLSVPKSGEGALSAAAAHPCASSVVLRTYDKVYELSAPAGADFEQAFSATPTSITAPDEPQSEAIDYLPDGSALITSGEGRNAPIFRTGCMR